jgi:rhodanese-related sulfurtransferase
VRFFAIRETLVLVGLAFLPGLGQALYFREQVSWQSPVSASESVTVAQARSWGSEAIWIDARPDDQFASEHVPGALQLNEDRWNELLPQMLAAYSPEKRVVVYCGSEGCGASREIARKLRDEAQSLANSPDVTMSNLGKALKKNVFVLEGGWETWLKAKR